MLGMVQWMATEGVKLAGEDVVKTGWRFHCT